MTTLFLLTILILVFAFGYLNGLNGGGSVVATVISSRALQPRVALALTIACMCLGPFLLGLAVASSISADLVVASAVTRPIVIAALVGAVSWIGMAAWLRLPCSTTHAFVGGLIGAIWAGFGASVIIPAGMIKLMAALFLSPILGIGIGFLIVKFLYRAASEASPRVNKWFKSGQVALCLLVAVAFGSNDGQKLMGILTLGVAATYGTELVVPVWAAGFSALAIATGTLISSQRIVRTLGGGLYKVEPIHGFGAQTASGIILLTASLLGGPVSGSHVVASAIVGAGSAERVRKVRWMVFRRILMTWVLTLPMAALAGAGITLILTGFGL